MNKPKFTQGPWILKVLPGATYRTARISDSNEQKIAEVPLPSEESQANAALISAAPEMYEAIENYLTKIENPISMHELEGLIAEFKRALKKARGES